MGIKNIEKGSFNYGLLKTWVDFWHNKVFYSKVELINTENIPEKGHLIFTPNHQNALMDALAVLCNIDRRLVFMARSDIFKKPVVASILYFLKILPIYRIRDGYDSLKKNKEIFQKTIDVLSNDESSLVMLPEGNHSGIRRLRPLKKGFARIAFQTEEANNYNLDIKIVPVGIYYEDYQAFRSKITLNFGKPISVSNYYEQYKEAPAIAFNLNKNELSDKMKPLIINIETEEYYSTFNTIRELYLDRFIERLKNGYSKIKTLLVQQTIVNQLEACLIKYPEKISELNERVNKYMNKISELNLENIFRLRKESFAKIAFQSIILIILFPAFLYGLLNNLLPYQITKWAEAKIKDPQFKSSFAFVVSLVSFPLFNILQTLIIIFFVDQWYWLLAYFISVPLSGVFAWYYKGWLRNMKQKWTINKLYRKRKSHYIQIQSDYEAILQLTDSIIEMDDDNLESLNTN